MPTVDEDLSQLEKDVRQLKIEYEQYFGGGRSRPPTEIEWRIELIVKRYGERGANMNFGQRYRYSGIAQTYARYRDLFRKRMRQVEEGTVVRHFGAAAKAIEAERVARQGAARRAASNGQEAITVAAVTCSNPDRESAEGQKLFMAFRDAKAQAGEDTSHLTKSGFQEFLTRKATELRGKSRSEKIEFTVSVEDGHVKLKARVEGSVPSKA